MTATKPRYQWLAGPNGTAHATDPRDRWRTLCGAKAVLERLAWPTVSKCRLCALRAGELEGSRAAAH